MNQFMTTQPIWSPPLFVADKTWYVHMSRAIQPGWPRGQSQVSSDVGRVTGVFACENSEGVRFAHTHGLQLFIETSENRH